MTLELNPKSAKTYNARGLAKYYLQDFKGAIEDYTRAIELEPKDAADFYFNRGKTKEKLNKEKDALEDFSRSKNQCL